MLRISKLADYAVVILAAMAGGQGERDTAGSISARTGLPEPTVAKVMKLLSKAGVITSTRGAGGGYGLETDASEITMAQVIQAIDGPISLTACVESSDQCCDFSHGCMVKGRWNTVNTAIKSALDDVRLSDMMSTANCHPGRTPDLIRGESREPEPKTQISGSRIKSGTTPSEGRI